MEIICPSCNKTSQGGDCPRCGCELGSLLAVRRAAEVELSKAAQSLRHSEAEEAAEAAARSWELWHSAEAARLGFLANIALDDFENALAWLKRSD